MPKFMTAGDQSGDLAQIWRKFGAKTESNVVQKTAERPGWERGLSALSYYPFATIACDAAVSVLRASGPVGPRR